MRKPIPLIVISVLLAVAAVSLTRLYSKATDCTTAIAWSKTHSGVFICRM